MGSELHAPMTSPIALAEKFTNSCILPIAETRIEGS